MSGHASFAHAATVTLTLVLCLILVSLAVAQNDVPVIGPDHELLRRTEQAASTPDMALDLDALLRHPRALADTVQDPVWQVMALPGRRLMQIPMIIAPLNEAGDLRRPPMELRGGRFLFWRIVEDDDDHMIDPQQPDAGRTNRDLDDGQLVRDRRIARGGYSALPASGRAAAVASPSGELPQHAPRLTRSVQVYPDGSLAWRMERSMLNANLLPGDEVYKLKIDRTRLVDKRPEVPRREVRGANEDPRVFRQRQLTTDQAYRVALADYRDLSDQVRDATEDFVVTSPQRIWAVYEVPLQFNELLFSGSEPLPWSISLDELSRMRLLAGRPFQRESGQPLSGELFADIRMMQHLLNSQHPYSQQMVASVARSGRLIRAASRGDAAEQLLESLLEAKDSRTSSMTIADLASTFPPTEVSVRLMSRAASRMSPTQQVQAMASMFRTSLDNSETQEQVLDALNRGLADPNGPPVDQALASVADNIRDEPTLRRVFGSGLTIRNWPEVRRKAAITWIVANAPTDRMATSWLNLGLLAQQDQLALDAMQEIRRQYIATARERSPLLIRSSGESFLRFLYSDYDDLNTLAWEILPAFVAVDERAGMASSRRPGQRPRVFSDLGVDITDTMYPLDIVVAAGLHQHPTPETLFAFITRPRPSDSTAIERRLGWRRPIDQSRQQTMLLLDLVLFADPEMSRQAVNYLLSQSLPVDSMLLELPRETQVAFLRQLYAMAGTDISSYQRILSTEPIGTRLIRWLAESLPGSTVDNLPHAIVWVRAAGGESAMISVIDRADDPSMRQAAIHLLARSAGADDERAQAMIAPLEAAREQSPDAITREWNVLRRSLDDQRMIRSMGPYQIQLRTGPARLLEAEIAQMQQLGQWPQREPGEKTTEATTITTLALGTVRLMVDGPQVQWSNNLTLERAPHGVDLIIQRPAELKSFEVPGMASVPLETAVAPIHLYYQPDGSWYALDQLPDGMVIELSAIPGRR